MPYEEPLPYVHPRGAVTWVDLPAAVAAAAPKWSTGEVNKMTVPKLKAALTELGLDTSGLKAVLKERLMGSGAVGN